VLTLLGKLAAQTGDKKQAIADLEGAAQILKGSAILPNGSRCDVRVGDAVSRCRRSPHGGGTCFQMARREPTCWRSLHVPRNLTILPT